MYSVHGTVSFTRGGWYTKYRFWVFIQSNLDMYSVVSCKGGGYTQFRLEIILIPLQYTFLCTNKGWGFKLNSIQLTLVCRLNLTRVAPFDGQEFRLYENKNVVAGGMIRLRQGDFTSGYSSFNWVRNSGSRCSIVFCFPKIFIKFFTRIVSVISSDPPCKDGNARFTLVPWRPLSDQKCGRYCCFSRFNSFSFW